MSFSSDTHPKLNPEIQVKLQLPQFEIRVGFLACNAQTPTQVWYSPTDQPCCAVGVKDSDQSAIVTEMSSEAGCYVVPQSEHMITVKAHKNKIVFAPTISCQFVTQGARTAQSQAQPTTPADARPAQMITHQILTVEDLLQDNFVKNTTFSENSTTVQCSFKLLCSEEEKLATLSQVENLKHMLKQHGCRVVTPADAAKMIQVHLENRVVAEKMALDKYMQLNGLVNPSPQNNVSDALKFASSTILNHVSFLDTAQRDVLQRHNASNSNNAGLFYIQLVMAMAPLIVNSTMTMGKKLIPQETKQVVKMKFDENARGFFSEFVKELTNKSVTAWTPRYQPDFSTEIIRQNGRIFVSTDTKVAGECQVYSANTFVAQAYCNTRLRQKSPSAVHSYSRISVADDCEGGACSIINPMLMLQEHNEGTISQHICKACQLIDSKTGDSNLAYSYLTHAEAFTDMALQIKRCLQTYDLGVASLLAKGVKLDANEHEGCNSTLHVKDYKPYWTQSMQSINGQPPAMGGHATGMIFEKKENPQLQFSVGSERVDIKTHGTSDEFCQSVHICEGTSHSQQLDKVTSKQTTNVSLNKNVNLPAQQMPAFLKLCEKYQKNRVTPLVEALNVNEIVTQLTSFSLSEKPKVFPCNFYALGQNGFYHTLLLSGQDKFFTRNRSQYSSAQFITQGADLAGNLSNDEVFTVRSHVGDEEKQCLHQFDETFWPHILNSNAVMQLFEEDGMIPSALPALVETDCQNCAMQKVLQCGSNQSLLAAAKNARTTNSRQDVNAQFTMRYAVNACQQTSLQQHAKLTTSRKQEVQGGFDKPLKFRQGPFRNMMQVSYNVLKAD